MFERQDSHGLMDIVCHGGMEDASIRPNKDVVLPFATDPQILICTIGFKKNVIIFLRKKL